MAPSDAGLLAKRHSWVGFDLFDGAIRFERGCCNCGSACYGLLALHWEMHGPRHSAGDSDTLIGIDELREPVLVA